MLFSVIGLLAMVGISHFGANSEHWSSKMKDVVVYRNLDYMGNNNPRQKLDLYLPENREKPKSTVVWLHSGGFRRGSKDKWTIASILLKEGFAVASVNYRLSQEATFPAQIIDVKTAVRFLRANAKQYGLSPEHIGVWGVSAGGYLAAMLGVTGDQKQWDSSQYQAYSGRVLAVCVWFGPIDFLLMDKHAGKHSIIDDDGEVSPLEDLMGAPLQSIPELVSQANPLNHVTLDDAPFLIMHGEQDKLIPYQQSESLHATLLEAGVDSQLEIIADAAHGGKQFHSPERLKRIINFFRTHLQP